MNTSTNTSSVRGSLVNSHSGRAIPRSRLCQQTHSVQGKAEPDDDTRLLSIRMAILLVVLFCCRICQCLISFGDELRKVFVIFRIIALKNGHA